MDCGNSHLACNSFTWDWMFARSHISREPVVRNQWGSLVQLFSYYVICSDIFFYSADNLHIYKLDKIPVDKMGCGTWGFTCRRYVDAPSGLFLGDPDTNRRSNVPG